MPSITSTISILLATVSCAAGEPAPSPRVPASTGATSLQIGGHARTYALHLPANATAGPIPLVIVLHGGFGDGERMERGLGFDALADREGFAVVYPDGINHHWNDGRVGNGATDVDDVGFIRALIDELVATKGIDARRVFVTGPSNGGDMSFRLGCELADRLVAIAPVIASIPVSIAPTCHPARPISVLTIDGVDDPLHPYKGGSVGLARMKSRGEVISAVASTDQFAHAAGCVGEPTTTAEPDRDPDDGTTVERRDYPGCPAGIAVTLVSILGGGHTWPGARETKLKFTGKTSHEFDATERIWRFFADHGRAAK